MVTDGGLSSGFGRTKADEASTWGGGVASEIKRSTLERGQDKARPKSCGSGGGGALKRVELGVGVVKARGTVAVACGRTGKIGVGDGFPAIFDVNALAYATLDNHNSLAFFLPRPDRTEHAACQIGLRQRFLAISYCK